MELAKIINHTFLRSDASKSEIQKISEEARKYGFYSVCIPPMWVSYAAELLKNNSVKVGTLIDFPLGASNSEVKVYEAKEAVQNSADEVDMVIHIGSLKSGHYKKVLMDIQAVIQAVDDEVDVKVTFETCTLTEEEIMKACELAKRAKADFVKISTAFVDCAATIENITLIKQVVGSNMGIEVFGGIETKEKASQMVEAGATRIATSSGVSWIRSAGIVDLQV
ncbi:MAG: deoxyribose-phosphate aldolase [Lactobacillales bacterium]|nr:deoxyribose-phosphate aldolase [Lactobacillales bacterium]